MVHFADASPNQVAILTGGAKDREHLEISGEGAGAGSGDRPCRGVLLLAQSDPSYDRLQWTAERIAVAAGPVRNHPYIWLRPYPAIRNRGEITRKRQKWGCSPGFFEQQNPYSEEKACLGTTKIN
ncbi:hypothetical protein [Sinorhizobium medicae]|uniref:hypothetical protein n=1 Tax=Sinorhizobium medicae TaxID=110321 RepID=UPI0021A2A1E1|nr:hypothetical protein [Sinorhizobium medicae]UWU12461.1 hypothetical protein N2598_30565 [Sinorhizobium medicae]